MPGGAPAEGDRFARVALWGSVITAEQFAECVAEQQRRANAGRAVPSLPQLLIERGDLTRSDAEAIYRVITTRSAEQWRAQFGQIALRKGYITEAQLRDGLQEQTRLVVGSGSAPVLGHLLLERGHMTEAQVLDVLRAQAQRRAGALHDLEAALRPLCARAKRLIHRHRRVLGGVIVAVALLAACALGAVAQAWAAAPKRYGVLCDQCGHRARVEAAGLAGVCTQCGRGWMLAPLECSACGTEFPLKIDVRRDGDPTIEPCPKCGTLDHVRVPDALKSLRPKPTGPQKTHNGSDSRSRP